MERAIFDDFAETYDAWFLTPQGKVVFNLELDLLLKHVGTLSGKTLFDVGIGTGIFATQFRDKGAQITGIDPSENMLEIAKKRGFKVMKGFGENIPLEDNSFDIVLAMTSLEFSRNPEAFISEIFRVAKTGGKVVVAVLNLWSFYGISRRVRGIFKRNLFNDAHFYSYFEIRRLLLRRSSSVVVDSSVFIWASAPAFVLRRAQALEAFGRKYLKPFGALLVASAVKE